MKTGADVGAIGGVAPAGVSKKIVSPIAVNSPRIRGSPDQKRRAKL
jgi:hypothetical protein